MPILHSASTCIHLICTLCIGASLGWTPLLARQPGRLHLQNGDILSGDLISVSNEGLRLQIPERDTPLDIPKGWPVQWQSTGESIRTDVPETCDTLTLRNGQALWGEMQRMDADTLHFQTLWGQTLPLPRKTVASVVLNTPTHNGRVVPEEWKLRVNQGETGPLTEDWTHAAGTLFHPRPLGHRLFHETHGAFKTCRLILEAEYPDRRKFCILRVYPDSSGENTRQPGVSLTLRSKDVTWRDKRHWQGDWVFPLPPEPERGPVAETLRVEAVYDAEQKKALIYINGKLEGTRGLFIEDPDAPLFKNPQLQFHMLGNQPIRIRKMALLEGTGTTSASGLKLEPALLLQNGDRLEAEVLSFDGETYTVKLGETSLPLPADRVMGIGLNPVQAPSSLPEIRITPHSPHPMLKVHSVELNEETLRLQMDGLESVLELPANETAMIDWPRRLPEEDPKTSFRVDLSDIRTITGELQSLDPEALRIQPLWSPEPLTLPIADLRELNRLKAPSDRRLHSMVVLHNGDVITGTVSKVENDILEIQSPDGGERHRVRLSDVRTLLNPGEKGASWIVDPIQLLYPNLPGDPDQLPQLTGEGVTYSRGLRIRHSLPTGNPGYHLKAKFSNTPNVSINLRMDSVIRNGKRMGVMMAVAGTGLNVFTGPGGKHEKFKIPTPPGAGRSLEVQVDKTRKRLQVWIDGNPICDLTNPDWAFADDAGELFMTGFTLGSIVEEFQLVALNETESTPTETDEAANLPASLWIEGTYQGKGRLIGLKNASPGFQLEEQKTPLPLDTDTGFSIRFTEPPTHTAKRSKQPLTLFLQDGVSRIQGSHPQLSEGTVKISSPSFPDGLIIPAEDVQRIEFRD